MLQEDMKNKEERKHPTQKPLALGRWILKRFANAGDKIFDPFAGSGTFLVASKQMGFDYVGCEINPDYIKITNERLSQKTIFDLMQPQDVKQEGGNGLPPTDKSVGIRPTIL